jgi:septal ring factor EnvC (AmiA/AmiB activator)
VANATDEADMAWRDLVNDVAPKMDNRVSTGNLLTLIALLIAGAVAWGTSQGDIKALAQRVDAGEKRDEKTTETLDQVKGTIIELKGDIKATKSDLERQGRQLDRIESILRALPQAQPPAQRPPQ